MRFLQNLQKFQARVWKSFTELTETPGRCTNVVPLPVSVHVPGYFVNYTRYWYEVYPYPGHRRTELAEVMGTGRMSVVRN